MKNTTVNLTHYITINEAITGITNLYAKCSIHILNWMGSHDLEIDAMKNPKVYIDLYTKLLNILSDQRHNNIRLYFNPCVERVEISYYKRNDTYFSNTYSLEGTFRKV